MRRAKWNLYKRGRTESRRGIPTESRGASRPSIANLRFFGKWYKNEIRIFFFDKEVPIVTSHGLSWALLIRGKMTVILGFGRRFKTPDFIT